MDEIKINVKGNYSKVGKFIAHKFSYIIDKGAQADKILKDKPRKRIVEKNFIDKDDNESLEKSKENESIDIFDENYRDKYYDIIGEQKNKYFNIRRSCAINKKCNIEDNKNDLEYEKKYKYHLLHHSQLDNKKVLNQEEKLLYLDQNQNNDFIYHKLTYSQSFCKMVGRNDKEKIKKMIENNLEKKNLKLNSKNNNKRCLNENNEYIPGNTKKKKKIKKNLKKLIKGIGMEKQLQRGILPEHHDVRIRTAKGLEIKRKNIQKAIRNISSSISSSFLLNKNKYLSDNKNNLRIFSSIIPNKNISFINNNNDKKNNNEEEKSESKEKRVFSSFNTMKNSNIINHPKSSISTKNILVESVKKNIEFNSDIINNNRTSSSYNINKMKKNIYSDKNNSYSFIYKSKLNINNMNYNNDNMFQNNKKEGKFRLFSTPVHNKAINFKKMLSRKYLNRVKYNDKIGAGSPLTPNYNLIYPKTVMKVMYNTKKNSSSKKEFKGLIGEYLHEINNKNISKLCTLQQFSNFSKMYGRGTKIDSKFPMFMNNVNTRSAFDIFTEKSLRMNHFSNGKLNNPFSSFNTKKSFNNIISYNKGKNKINGKYNKEKRMEYYNNNIDNIFKKVIYDDIVDNNEKACNKNEDLLDLRKNPQLAKTINLSYKNLISDYYRLNLDYLDKDSFKEKIDGITFGIIKNSNRI